MSDEETETMLPNGRRAPVEDAEFSETGTAIEKFNPLLGEIAALAEEANGLKISSPNDKAGYEAVRVAKSKAVSLRGANEKIRVGLKEGILKYGRDVDSAAKKYDAMIRDIEGPLAAEKARIDAIVEEEKARKQAEINERVTLRIEALTAVGAANAIHPLELPGMAEADFQAHLAVATTKWNEEQRVKAEQEAELARLRKAEEEAKAKEAAALEAQRKEMAEQQAKLDAQRREQEAEANKLRAESERIERDKREAEEAKRREAEAKQRGEELEKAKAEAAEKARAQAIAEAEARAKREAEEKAEAERKAKAEAERKAAQASDREKLEAFLSGIRSVPLPNIRDPKMQGILVDFTNAIVALDKALR